MIKLNMKPFTDNKKKIHPEVTSDWVFSVSGRNNQIQFSSILLGVSFDVPLAYFINDLKRLNINIIGDKLIGGFLFDGSRHIFSELEYAYWREEQDKNNANHYPKEHLIPGRSYIDADDNKIVFLGTKYVVKAKYSVNYLKAIEGNEFSDYVTKMSKKHIFILKSKINLSNFYYRKNFLDNHKAKILSEESPTFNITPEKINFLFEKYCQRLDVVYFEDFSTTGLTWTINDNNNLVYN